MRSVALGVALAVSLGTTVWADDNSFTAADVLAWDQDSQDWYFQVSVSMAGVIAAQNNSPQAPCINDWYFASSSNRDAQNESIRAAMARFSSYHPASVVVAVIERNCGQISFTN